MAAVGAVQRAPTSTGKSSQKRKTKAWRCRAVARIHSDTEPRVVLEGSVEGVQRRADPADVGTPAVLVRRGQTQRRGLVAEDAVDGDLTGLVHAQAVGREALDALDGDLGGDSSHTPSTVR